MAKNPQSSTNAIFGQIGAAKIFTSSIAGALDMGQGQNEAEIQELEEQLSNSKDSKIRAKLQKKINRLKKSNKVMNKANKLIKGATDLLMKLAKAIDIGKKALINWLAFVIVKIIPALEIAVKAVLLSNIKKMVSCAMDPRIPDAWRVSGVTINEREIDPRHILRSSPYSTYGRDQYFGVFTDDKDLVGEPLHLQARAKDMNVFIWYVKNCAKYASAFIIDNGIEGSNGVHCYFKGCSSTDTLYNKHEFQSDGKHWFLPGCTFKQTAESSTVFICVDRAGSSAADYTYTIVPVSQALQGDVSGVVTGCNWYKSISVGQSLAQSKTQSRNYNKAKPLFKLDYSNSYNQSAKLPKNNFKFQILPAPFKVGGGFITDLGQNASAVLSVADKAAGKLLGEEVNDAPASASKATWPDVTSLRPHYARFDHTGKYSKKGKFSIDEHAFYVKQLGYTEVSGNKKRYLTFSLIPKDTSSKFRAFLVYDTVYKSFELTKSQPINEKLDALTHTEASKVLTECYMGKTVYEFNYDYIMSFRLFDAKVISANLVKALMNLKFPDPWAWLKNTVKGWFSGDDDETDVEETAVDQLYIDNMVDQMIQSMIEEEDEEYTDCFYTFSNQEYLNLEKKTNEQLENGTLLTTENGDALEAYNILAAYSADATLHEQTEVVTNTLTRVSDIMNTSYSSGGGTGSGIYTVEDEDDDGMGFFQKAIKFLISCIINAILTPKVLLLIQINQKLMGNDPLSLDKNYSFSIQDVLNGVKGVITSIIKEIIDTILQELLRLIMKYIMIILSSYIKQLAMEYARKWIDLLKQLIMCFQFNFSKMKSQQTEGDNTMSAISAALDNVYGADIDTLAEQLVPKTNPC